MLLLGSLFVNHLDRFQMGAKSKSSGQNYGRIVAINGPSPYLKIEAECIACEWCKYNCPVENCITFETVIATIHHDLCIECDRCIYVCPVDVIIPLRAAQPQKKGVKSG